MTAHELYRSKFVTMDEALSKIPSNVNIGTAAYGNEPEEFLANVHKIADRVENVKIFTQLTNRQYPYIMDDSLRGKIDMLSFFYGPGPRAVHKTGRISFIPVDLHNTGKCGTMVNVFVASVPPIDDKGFINMCFSQQAESEFLENADLVIFEVNKNYPRTQGTNLIPVDKVDYFVEVDYPAHTIPAIPITPVERAIAANVASLMKDGDCIQLGIGGMPNAVGEALMDKKDLGIHTEMLTSVMGKLMREGVVNNSRKNFHPKKTICAFAMGDQELYDYIDNNPMLEMHDSAYVNDPYVIAQNDNMVSINTALEIDLCGQVCSESIGSKQFSGPGGASDFAYGAFHSKGGRGIVAVSSTSKTKNGVVSKIQPILSPGAIVTIRRTITDYIVTEYGIAHLRYKSIAERVKALIAIAHPDFRDELRKQAEKLMLW